MTEMLRSGSVMTRAAMGRAPTTAFGLSCFAFVAVLATRFASGPPGFRHLTEPASDKFGEFLGFTDFDAASYGHWPCSNWTTEPDSDAWVDPGLEYDELKVEEFADLPLFRHLQAPAMEAADNKLVAFKALTTSGGQGASLVLARSACPGPGGAGSTPRVGLCPALRAQAELLLGGGFAWVKRQEMKRLGGGGVPGWSVVKMGTQRAMASCFYVFAVAISEVKFIFDSAVSASDSAVSSARAVSDKVLGQFQRPSFRRCCSVRGRQLLLFAVLLYQVTPGRAVLRYLTKPCSPKGLKDTVR